MSRIILANLPQTSEINPESFVIIERPGIGQGTYKSTVGDLQEAITVHAKVEQVDLLTTITVQDINGTTQASILTPTAKIVDNGDNTATITITDTYGTTYDTIVSRIILDEEPTEGSPNFLTSGTIYIVKTALEDRIAEAESRISDLEERATSAENRLTDAEAQITELEEQSGDASERIAELEAKVARLEALAEKALVTEDYEEPQEITPEPEEPEEPSEPDEPEEEVGE